MRLTAPRLTATLVTRVRRERQAREAHLAHPAPPRILGPLLRAGDFDALVAVLHPDVVLQADFSPGRQAAPP